MKFFFNKSSNLFNLNVNFNKLIFKFLKLIEHANSFNNVDLSKINYKGYTLLTFAT